MAVIEFEHVSKAYRLGTSRTSLREAISQAGRRLFSRNGVQGDNQLFWALDDVSFRVEPEEVLGIIGHNGAGKSTTLKLLSRVTFPTKGHIRTRGRMAALIELGAGFHPDLSGRENIYLNGAILGLKKREIDAQFSHIVEFAELERFIDTPVKRYSSGMYVRLAFAVAAHVKADLLLVDEVLSVGDMTFQQKCLAKMNELRDSGAAIIFVSHNLPAVQMFCNRVLLLKSGQIATSGEAAGVIRVYRALEQESRKAMLAQVTTQPQTHPLPPLLEEVAPDEPQISQVELLDTEGRPVRDLRPGEGLRVRCHFIAPNELKNPVCMVRVRRRSDAFICFSLYSKDPSQPSLQGEGAFEAAVDQLLLVPGPYSLEASLYSDEFWERGISGPIENFTITGRLRSESAGIYQPNARWSFNLKQ